jgi:hypothetical protein
MLARKKNSISPRWHSFFTRRIVIIGAPIKFIGRKEVEFPFLETIKNLVFYKLTPQLVTQFRQMTRNKVKFRITDYA